MNTNYPQTDIYLGRNKYRDRVWIEVKIDDGKLSISGRAVPPHCHRDGNSGAWGQIQSYLPDTALGREVKAVWNRWHLNDMRAGCEHQRAEGWDKRPIDPSKPTDTYGIHFEGQKSPTWNMLTWVRPEEHPDGLMTAECPECGYRFGSAWLTEELPTEVADQVATWKSKEAKS